MEILQGSPQKLKMHRLLRSPAVYRLQTMCTRVMNGAQQELSYLDPGFLVDAGVDSFELPPDKPKHMRDKQKQ